MLAIHPLFVSLTAWNATGGATLTVVNNTTPVSSALPNSLRIDVPTHTTGAAGALNTGYWGIKVQKGSKYTGTFYAKSSTFSGTITAALKSADGKTTFASKNIQGVGKNWKKFEYTLEPSTSADGTDNVFSVTVDAKQAAGQTIHFGLFTLFPPTWNVS
jgi:alpha-L-arabinofuranosidase